MRAALRSTVVGLAAAAVVVGVAAVGATGAGAATEGGQILTKVTGSAYSADGVIYGVSKDRKPAVYSYEIKNTGTVQTQYSLGLIRQQGDATWQIFDGKTPITEAKFYTPPVAPGAVYAFTVQATPAVGGITGPNNATVDFFVPDTGLYVGTTDMYVFQSTTFTGSTGGDFFVKNGPQPWVDGLSAEQSAAVGVGKSANFSIRLQNDTSTPHTMRLANNTLSEGQNCPTSDFTEVVKMGSRDITNALAGNGFDITLAPGAHIMLKETVKFVGPDAGCTALVDYINDELSGSDEAATVQVPVAAG